MAFRKESLLTPEQSLALSENWGKLHDVPGIVSINLLGSGSRDVGNEESDIDLLILTAKKFHRKTGTG